jgi:hypothetical protein
LRLTVVFPGDWKLPKPAFDAPCWWPHLALRHGYQHEYFTDEGPGKLLKLIPRDCLANWSQAFSDGLSFTTGPGCRKLL